ncbi:intermembrane phospholipid transport protein YdbH family protein [Chlorobium limicola]
MEEKRRISAPERILAALPFLALLVPLSVWLSFPWYAQAIIDRALKGQPFHVRISGVGIPGPSGVGFRRLDVSFTAPADSCVSSPTAYRISISGGKLGWSIRNPEGKTDPALFQADLRLDADSLRLNPDPAQYIFHDSRPKIDMRLEIRRRNGLSMEFMPSSIAYAIDSATVTREKLSLSGISYRILLTRSLNWQQPPDTLRIARLYSDGNPSPVGNFRALFGSKRDPLKPCKLLLSNCSVALFAMQADSDAIEYDLKDQSTRFTLRLAEIPLDSLPWFRSPVQPLRATGKLSGSIPIEFRDSTVLVRNAILAGEREAQIVYLDKREKRLFSIDLGEESKSKNILNNLNATIVLNSRNNNQAGIGVEHLSTLLFGGTLEMSPLLFDPLKSEYSLSLEMKDIRLLDRLRYHDAPNSAFKGAISGTIPLTYGKKGLVPGNLRLSSTASFSGIPVRSIPGMSSNRPKQPFADGSISGTLPIEYANSSLRITNGTIAATKGSALFFYDKENRKLFSVDLGTPKSNLLKKLNASATIKPADRKPRQFVLNTLSATALDGNVQVSPFTFSLEDFDSGIPFSVKLDNVNIPERFRLHGDFKASLKGAMSGTLPVTVNRNGFAISNARLHSTGGGTISVTPTMPERTATERIFGAPTQDAHYTFSAPDLRFSRRMNGSTDIDFSLKELQRKTAGGELKLLLPKGLLSLWSDTKRPDVVTLRNFSAGFFDGTVEIERVDYDMEKKTASTTLKLNNIPLQKLLDLQGTKKVYATGTIGGSIPVTMTDQIIEINDGAMNAESNGQIIYATSPEERAAANQGLRTTYEALSNFLYVELLSSISMAPDGKSLITIRLKGNNPEFQAGRPVELNLNVEQNLLDLMRSLTIPTNVEQIISEKALKSGR